MLLGAISITRKSFEDQLTQRTGGMSRGNDAKLTGHEQGQYYLVSPGIAELYIDTAWFVLVT
jgi:hypothetical protein